MDVYGPIAATADDLALTYAIVAGPDPACPESLLQPPVSLDGLGLPDLKGLKIATIPNWNKLADPAFAEPLSAFCKEFERLGAHVVEIDIEPYDLFLLGRGMSSTDNRNPHRRLKHPIRNL